MTEEIGVLLPLQLETKFLTPDDDHATWRVMLRVIPQPPSVDGHSRHVTDDELRAVEAFRTALGRTGRLGPTWFGTAAHRRAFGLLVARVGAPRAVWLAQQVRTRRVDGRVVATAPSVTKDGPAVVRGLPPTLRVLAWTLGPDGERPTLLGTLPEGGGSIPDELPLPDLSNADSVLSHWITNWEEAVAVGLGGTFDLPAGVGPEELGGIGVSGLGVEAPGALWAAHAHDGLLAETPLATSTNSVGGATTALSAATGTGEPTNDGAPDEEAWWQALLRQVGGAQTSLDGTLRRYVGGDGLPSLARPSGRDRVLAETEIDERLLSMATPDPEEAEEIRRARAAFPPETRLAPLVLHALWPVLWGASALEEWELDPSSVGAVGSWALRHVNPEGPLPAMRFGGEPYAMLPLTLVSRWTPTAEDPPELDLLVRALHREQSDLHARLVAAGTVRGADRRRYAQLLGRGGSAREFAVRRATRSTTAATWGAAAMSGLVDWASELRTRDLDRLGLTSEVPDPFLELTPLGRAIDLPLVQARVSTVWGADKFFQRVPLPALLETILAVPHALRAAPPVHTQLVSLFGALGNAWFVGEGPDGGREAPLGILPDSLLSRLLVSSCLTVNGWGGHPAGAAAPPLGRGLADGAWWLSLVQVAALLDRGPHEDPLGWNHSDKWEAVRPGDESVAWFEGAQARLPAFPAPTIDPDRLVRLENAVGAVLETCSTRIDPWLTGIAWQRLRAATDPDAASSPIRRLGAYGWVHGPFSGRPGPTDSGLLHTPSQGQTLVATMARDNFRDHQEAGTTNEQGRTPWALALDGTAIRIAGDLSEDLRDGHHLHEIVGREVERILTAPGGPVSPHVAAQWLRTTFPMHVERPDERQVCDGVAVLARYLDPTQPPPPELPADRDRLTALRVLRSGIDALADLSLLDGALAASQRQPARAAGAMDGVAGTGPVADHAYPRTPATGRTVLTRVLSVIPWRGVAPDADAAALAEPSVAALLVDRFGGSWSWQVHVEGEAAPRSVTLADLHLQPIDTLALSSGQLRAFAATAAGLRGVPTGRWEAAPSGTAGEVFEPVITEHENRRWEVRIGDAVSGTITLAGTGLDPVRAAALPEPELTAAVLECFFAPAATPAGASLQVVPVAEGEDPAPRPLLWCVRDRCGEHAGSFDLDLLPDSADPLPVRIRRAAAAPLAVVVDPPELGRAARLCSILGRGATERDLLSSGATTAPYVELRARYVALHADLRAAISQLRDATRKSATESVRVDAIRRGVRWGVTPDAGGADGVALGAALAGLPPPAGATDLRSLATTMLAALTERRAGAVAPSAIPKAPSGARGPDLREKGRPEGVESLAKALSALVAPQGNLPILLAWSRDELVTTTGLAARQRGRFESDWLSVVAPVRPALARVEAFQLEADPAGAALSVWSSAVDPWAPGGDGAARGLFGSAPPPFHCALGPAGALDDATLAVGVIDSYEEVLPLRARDTHAAFGFNAPLARAPQAVILAVPPNADEPLTDELVEAMLVELRQAVVARSATMVDRAESSVVTRTTWLPDDDGVGPFEPASRYVRL